MEIRGWVFVFMWFVMFQGLLHHLFLELVKHVSSVIAREGAYSIEFSVISHRRTLSLCFWEGKRFLCLPMLHRGRDNNQQKAILILFHGCSVRFLVMRQSFAVAVRMPTL